MLTFFASRIEALSGWRAAVAERLGALGRFLAEHELADDSAAEIIAALRQRLGSDKLVLAFVAEFSRGKSELINAIFFADSGRRLLPAAPGRTTMCPVEIGWDPAEPPALQLLPVETRLDGVTLAELATRASAWKRISLEALDADELAETLLEVMRTKRVSIDAAAALGLWNAEQPADNPPLDADGRVEVPVWRHALINYRHPLLERGLVVIDTPGLNALGAEPELTLGLLPRAHATVFILAADAGVTRSDLQVWRDHLGARGDAAQHFAVLNKIDVLRDPLLNSADVERQIEAQRQETSRLLGLPAERVFPLSAREALVARTSGDAAALVRSRLPELEGALGAQLLHERRTLLAAVADDGLKRLHVQATRHVGEKRRQAAEQLLELRGLRGKSSARQAAMLQRVTAEAAEFELCQTRLRALRSVHARMLEAALQPLSNDVLHDEVSKLQQALRSSLLNLGARKAFTGMCARLVASMRAAQTRSGEIQAMLGGSFAQLNAEFGFGLAMAPPPDLEPCVAELESIERNYVQYLGLRHALRLADANFNEQFRRMLVAKLRVVFETASAEIEFWNRTASAQVDTQLRERRGSFKRRREALERVQAAAGELEQRIGELEAQAARLDELQQRVAGHTEAVRQALRGGAAETPAPLAPAPQAALATATVRAA